MVICVKCGKEQVNRRSSKCEYDGYEIEGIYHVWRDREVFLNELREKLPPFIEERIAAWQEKRAEKQAAFPDSLKPYNKKLNKIQAEYEEYLNEGIPRDVEKKQQDMLRSVLPHIIGGVIGFIVVLIVLISLGLPFWVILIGFVVLIFLIKEPVGDFLQSLIYAGSQNFADDLAREWRYNHEIDEKEDKIKSDIEEKKDNWNYVHENFNRAIHNAERALVGSDEELLDFYQKYKPARDWYLENIYEEE